MANAEKKRDVLFEEYRFPTQTTTVIPSNNQNKISVICSGLFAKMAYTFLNNNYTGTTLGAKASSYGASSTQRVTFTNMSNSDDINDNKTYIRIKNTDTYKIAKSIVVPVHTDFYNQQTNVVTNELGDVYNYKSLFPVFNSDLVVRFRRDDNGVPGEIITTTTVAREDYAGNIGQVDTIPTVYTDGNGTHSLYQPNGAIDQLVGPHKAAPDVPVNGTWNQELTITLPDVLLSVGEYFWIEADPIEIEVWEYWYFHFVNYPNTTTFDYVKKISTAKRAILRYVQSSSYDKNLYGEGYTVKDGVYSVIENTGTGTYYKPQFVINYVYDLESMIKTVVEKTGLFPHTYISPDVIAGNVELSGLYLAGKSAATILDELFTLGTTNKDSIIQTVTSDGDYVITSQERLSIDNNFYLLIDRNNKLYNIDGSEYKRICPVAYWARLNIISQMDLSLATGDSKYFYITTAEYNFKNQTYTYSSDSLQKGTVSSTIKVAGSGTIPTTGTGDMEQAVYDTDNDGIVDRAETADSVAWDNITGKPSSFGSGDMAKSTYDTDNDGKVDVAEVAESVAWSGVSGKPSPVTNLTQSVIDNSHTHANKSILDNLTQGVLDNNHTHANKAVLDNVTQTILDNSHAPSILGTKQIDETNIANRKVTRYNSTSGKIEYSDDNLTSTGNVGAEPSSPTSGDLYLTKDIDILERYNGSAWEKWTGIRSVAKKPVVSDFTWLNQGSSTATDTNRGLYLETPASTYDYLRGLRKALSFSTTYQITVGLEGNFIGQYNRAGIFIRNTAGNMISMGTMIGSDRPKKVIQKHTSETSIFGSYDDIYHYKEINWYRIYRDGTNRKFYYSNDGQNWILVRTATNTDFMTSENEVGLYLISNTTVHSSGATFFYLDIVTT